MSTNLYAQAKDYEQIKKYIEPDPAGFEPEINAQPFQPDFGNIIIIDCLPIVNREKAVKLKNLLMKLYTAVCDSIRPDDLYFPFDESTDMTPGFAFLKFPTHEDAENAVNLTNNHVLDKNHTFKVNIYKDLDIIGSVPDSYVSQDVPFQPTPDCTSWLCDDRCRDQFLLRHNHETEVYWANLIQGENPTLVYGGEREKQMNLSWCESFVQWSPKGTYLATFHPQGIKLWGNTLFEPQGRYLHKAVELLEFSPCELYMVTSVFSSYDSPEAMIVWDVRSFSKLRAFPLKDAREAGFWVQADIVEESKGGKKTERQAKCRVVSYNADNASYKVVEGLTEYDNISAQKVVALQDPNKLKWSPTGQYLARLGAGIIQVYELPSMTLLDRKSIAAKDVFDFAWSPSDNVISYWSPASGNLPAIINIIRIPDRTVISSRKLFDVQDGKMTWQNDGDYLCVRMTKISGKKKTSMLMLFRIREPEVPVELLELNETVLDVQWEPSKEKFAVVYGEARNPTIAIYTMGGQVTTGKGASSKRELTLMYTITGKQCNEIIWSPAGGVLAIAYIASDACLFELYDIDNNVSLAQRRHDRGTKLLWDPSGRCIASCTLTALRQTTVRGQPDDGYNIYTFQGTVLCQVRQERLYQFLWRPRPRDILTPQEKKDIIKNLKKYEKIFDKEDRQKKQQFEAEVHAERKKLASAFLQLVNQKKVKYLASKQKRINLRDGYDSDDDTNFQVDLQLEETVVSSKTQVVVP